jgi:3-hydroxyethyl bacteriochlorophyllide a dehydrogenase
MKATAVVFDNPKQLSLQALDLPSLLEGQVEVAVQYSGISTGTERMLWDGSMPPFPGMGYPLVPGYETVGQVVRAPQGAKLKEGQTVFVPGANCFTGVRSLFGGAASRLVVSDQKILPVANDLGSDAVLFGIGRYGVSRGIGWRSARAVQPARFDHWSRRHGPFVGATHRGCWLPSPHCLGNQC